MLNLVPQLNKFKYRQELLKTILFLVVFVTAGMFIGGKLNIFCPESSQLAPLCNHPAESAAVLPLAQGILGATASPTSSPVTRFYAAHPELNDLEYTYQSTFRSCLGVDCFDEKVMLPRGLTSRVGILGIPNSGSNAVYALIKQVTGADFAKFEVLSDTHVPPYGYGKNHGWSSIVRLSRRLVQHSYSLVEPSTSPVNARWYGLQARQIVRWHCRLSHVAAHTRMLTVFVDDLLSQPVVELEKILSFIGYKVDRPALVLAAPVFISALREELRLHLSFPSPEPGEMGRLNVDEDRLLDRVIPADAAVAVFDALRDELSISKTLTRWPCKSFRELLKDEQKLSALDATGAGAGAGGGAGTGKGAMRLSPQVLAANCSAPHVKCSVHYDVNGG